MSSFIDAAPTAAEATGAPLPRYVTIMQLAQHFNVSVSTIRAWLRQGEIPEGSYLRIGNTFRFSIPEVEAAMRGKAAKKRSQVPLQVAPLIADEDY